MFPDDIYLDLAEWPPFGEKFAHRVNHMFPLLCLFVVLVVSHLCFEEGNFVLIAPVPGHFIDLLCVTLGPGKE